MHFLPMAARTAGNLQRVLLVALLAPALLITVLATTPALLVLPFLPRGTERAIELLQIHGANSATLLNASRAEDSAKAPTRKHPAQQTTRAVRPAVHE
jgi:hypothetical protein